MNIFSYFSDNIHCGYSLEVLSQQGTSNEYQNIIFLWVNKRKINIFCLKNAAYLGPCWPNSSLLHIVNIV